MKTLPFYRMLFLITGALYVIAFLSGFGRSLLVDRQLPSIGLKHQGQIYDLLNSGDKDAALAHVETLALLSPDDTDLLLLQAKLYYERKHFDAFQATLDQIVLMDPRNVEAGKLYANYLKEKGEEVKAFNIYRNVLMLNPNDVEALRASGSILMKQNKMNEATTYFQRATEIEQSLEFQRAISQP